MEDVTKLTDEELDKRLNGEEEVAEPAETQPSEEEPIEDTQEEAKEEEAVEKPVEAAEESKTPEEEPEAEKPKEEEPKQPSRRETLRIQDILAKRDAASKETSQPAKTPSKQDVLDYSNELDADPEVITRLEEDRQKSGDARYNEGLAQAEQMSRQQTISSEFRTNIKMDFPLVKEKLDKLDQEDVRELDLEYLRMNKYDAETGIAHDPVGIGYADFITASVERAERFAERLNEQTVKNITKQASQTGLRPDGSAAKALNLNQQPGDMSDEELDAYLKKAGWASNKRN
jgi:hypothetical protein